MFIEHPTDRFRRSITNHNSDLIVAADWVELTVLLSDSDDGVTSHEIIDYLIESQIYEDQGYCAEFVESVLSEIRLRARISGSEYPLSVDKNQRVIRSSPWEECVGLTFCLTLSTLPYFSGYHDFAEGNYVEQGELFELVSVEAMRSWFPEWDVRRTGWGGGQGKSLTELLDEIASITGEDVRTEALDFVADSEKDLGLDLAAVRQFSDDRPALPVIFGQCASGRNWQKKLQTPDTSRWKQLLTLTHTPLKAFTFPFRLGELDYPARRSQHKGLLMDRLRLLPRGNESNWLQPETHDRLVDWVSRQRRWLIENYLAESEAPTP